jgi:D-3-phosphoglycerate dehydrogenase
MSLSARIAVTPPAFRKSAALRREILTAFPTAVFNETDDYLADAELIRLLRDCQGAVVGRDRVTRGVLDALPNLKIVAKYGVGLDNIDEAALHECDVVLGWTPGVNRRSVAELTLCFMLGLVHNVFKSGWALKQNIWKKDGGCQIAGKTVGIIGCGNVGKEVIRLLQPLDCRILVCDILDVRPFCQSVGAEQVEFDRLIRESDVITLHVPLTQQTRNMVAGEAFANMKADAFLINTSRGEVVGEPALKDALQNNRIAGAALDVFLHEPPDDMELLALPNLMVTPHIGGNAVEAVEAMGRSAIGHLVRFFESNASGIGS